MIMTRKELCGMCMDYSTDVKCDNEETCKLQTILTENAKLKEENKWLRKENEEMRIRESWEKFPEAMGR